MSWPGKVPVSDRPAAPVCEVWWGRTAAADGRLARLLPASELERLSLLRLRADRDRSLVGWALVRALLSRRTGLPPQLIGIDRRCARCGCGRGKPRLAGSAGGVDFSLSHSGDHVAVAVCDEAAVGVDVEALGQGRGTAALRRRVLSPDEIPAVRDDRGFLRCWVRKEAVTKAVGVGLSAGLRRFSVSAPHRPARLLTWPDEPGLPSTSTLVDLAGPPGCLGSVAVLAPGARVTESDGAPVLSEALSARPGGASGGAGPRSAGRWHR